VVVTRHYLLIVVPSEITNSQ